MRRRSLLKRLERDYPVPERLSAENIKTVLDRNSAVIPTVSANSEVRLNSTRRGLIKSAALAAASILVVCGLTVARWGQPDVEKPDTSDEIQRTVADTTGLTGLRGGSYKSLHSFLLDCDGKYSFTSPMPDNSYVYMGVDDAQNTNNSDEIREFYERNCIYDGVNNVTPVTESYASRERRPEELKLKLLVQQDDLAFSAGRNDVEGYILKNGEPVLMDYDFLGDTYLMQTLAQNDIFKEFGTELRPYVIGMLMENSRLTIAYSFHLPDRVSEKLVVSEYCGFCVYDVSDRDNISLVYEYEQPGLLKEFALTEEGRLTVIGEYEEGKKIAELEMYNSGVPKFLPQVYENGQSWTISEDSIYIANKAEDNRLTIMSSFKMGKNEDNIENTDCIVMTLSSSGIMVTDDHVMFLVNYWNETTEGTDPKTHAINVDTADGLKITAAKYLDCFIDEYNYSYSEENGIRYIASWSNVVALNEDLEYLGECERETPINDYMVSEGDIYRNFGRSDILIMDGSMVYYGDVFDSYSFFENNIIIREIVDMSDPANPKHNDVSLAPYAAPAVTGCSDSGRGFIKLNDKLLLHRLHEPTTEYKEGDSIAYHEDFDRMVWQLISLDPERSEETTDNYYYATREEKDEYGNTHYPLEKHEEYNIRKAGVIDKIYDEYSSFIPLVNYPNLISYSTDEYICLMNDCREEYDEREITEEEYENLTLDDIGKFYTSYDENENPHYYYINEVTHTQDFQLLRYSNDGLEDLGKVCGITETFDNNNDVPHYRTMRGMAVYGGYVYCFGDFGALGSKIP